MRHTKNDNLQCNYNNTLHAYCFENKHKQCTITQLRYFTLHICQKIMFTNYPRNTEREKKGFLQQCVLHLFNTFCAYC